MAVAIPLADVAESWLRDLDRMAGHALATVDGATLLGERARLGGFAIPGRISAGGGCRMFDARGGAVALNLARADDWTLLPALFEIYAAFDDDSAVVPHMAQHDVREIVARGRMLGLAIAAVSTPTVAPPAVSIMTATPAVSPPTKRAPRVLDLSALWAGPLAAHLLGLAGAEVIKVDSATRPDAMRNGDPRFFALLDQGKASVLLDLADSADRTALLALIARADIVIEAARPRALLQLGIDADALVRRQPGLSWITITGHGAHGEPANWVGFGDDCGMAAGLGTALHAATGRAGFVGDAIGDPLTGIRAAGIAWQAWASGRGGRYAIAMTGVVAEAMAIARRLGGFDQALVAWAAASGTPFPILPQRAVGKVSAAGADTRRVLAEPVPC